MRILVLSEERSYTTDRLEEAAKSLGHALHRMNPRSCSLVLGTDRRAVYYQGGFLRHVDVVMPRDGAETTDYELDLLHQFERMGVPVINDEASIALSRDKFRSLQSLATEGVPVPRSVLLSSPKDLDPLLEEVGGLPVILKLLVGTHGIGVMIAETRQSLLSILDVFWELGKRIMIQEFVAESAGTDLRALVVGDEVVASMRRHAPVGEFRANIFLGGRGEDVKLDDETAELAIRSARILGLEIAGVDLLESKDGPKVIEINSAPDFEGLEACTGVDIARAKLAYVAERVQAG